MGIRRQVFLITLLPLLLLATVLSLYFTSSRLADRVDALTAKGESIAMHMAQAAEYGVFAGNRDSLQALATAALSDPEVQSVRILDRQGERLAEASRLPGAGSDRPLLERMRFERPIHASPIEVLDYAPPSGEEAEAEVIGRIHVELSLEPLHRRQREVLASSVAITAVALLIAALVGQRFGHRVTGPLRTLTGTVQALRDGDLESRSRLPLAGELGQLQEGVNEMADSLANAQRHLKNQVAAATAHLVAKIEEVEIANRRLSEAKRDAERAAEAKADFLANVSHELRTPLNGILGYGELLAGTGLDATQREYVDVIQRSAKDLVAFASSVLNYTRLDSGRLELLEQEFDLVELVDETRRLLLPAARNKALALYALPYADVPARVHGDPLRLKQVLINLIGNAVKFTEQGRIVVRVLLDEDPPGRAVLRFEVSDTGRGIPPESREQLFTAFAQVDPDGGSREQGSGLGLSITKRLVELMGGSIEVHSAVRRGSRFAFTFPLRGAGTATPAPEGPAGEPVLLLGAQRESLSELALALQRCGLEPDVVLAAETRPQDLPGRWRAPGLRLRLVDLSGDGEAVRRLLAEAGVPGPQDAGFDFAFHRQECGPSSVPLDPATGVLDAGAAWSSLCRALGRRRGPAGGTVPEPGEGAARRTLVVDDNPVNRRVAAALLDALGAEVEEAAGGEEALSLLAERPADLVLLDVRMPVMDGVETLRRMRRDLPGRFGRVVALTAVSLPEERARLLRAGMDDCLTKPVSGEMLRAQLERCGTRPATPASPTGAAQDPAWAMELEREIAADLRRVRQATADGDRAALGFHLHRLRGALYHLPLQAGLIEAVERLDARLSAGDEVAPGEIDGAIADLQRVLGGDGD